MNVNCVKIGSGLEFFNITNNNLLIRFNKTCEIISIVTRVLYILLTIAATTPSVERVYSKARV